MGKTAIFVFGLLIGCFAYAQARCDRKFSAVSPTHTACKSYNLGLSARGVTKKTQQEIVDQHNKLRGSVEKYGQPAATYMMKLYWDEEIAMIAQKHADACKWGHDKNIDRSIPGRMSVGQNLARGYGTWRASIQGWFDEYKDYNYYTAKQKRGREGKMIGHYTAVVWAKTTRIGCGYAACPGMRHHYVCNYGPAGNGRNMNGSNKKPYKSGRKGSACPNTLKNGLCDCGSKICLNGAPMDPNTCTCKCKHSYTEAPNCGLVCSKARDKSWACGPGKHYSRQNNACRDFGNVGIDYCPVMCNLCPAGDLRNQPEGNKSVAKQPAPKVAPKKPAGNRWNPSPPRGGGNRWNPSPPRGGGNRWNPFPTRGGTRAGNVQCLVRVDGRFVTMGPGTRKFGNMKCTCKVHGYQARTSCRSSYPWGK